jgi:hypothetical protein
VGRYVVWATDTVVKKTTSYSLLQAEILASFHAKYLLLSDFADNWNASKSHSRPIKFYENPSAVRGFLRADRQTDMAKLIGAFLQHLDSNTPRVRNRSASNTNKMF